VHCRELRQQVPGFFKAADEANRFFDAGHGTRVARISESGTDTARMVRARRFRSRSRDRGADLPRERAAAEGGWGEKPPGARDKNASTHLFSPAPVQPLRDFRRSTSTAGIERCSASYGPVGKGNPRRMPQRTRNHRRRHEQPDRGLLRRQKPSNLAPRPSRSQIKRVQTSRSGGLGLAKFATRLLCRTPHGV